MRKIQHQDRDGFVRWKTFDKITSRSISSTISGSTRSFSILVSPSSVEAFLWLCLVMENTHTQTHALLMWMDYENTFRHFLKAFFVVLIRFWYSHWCCALILLYEQTMKYISTQMTRRQHDHAQSHVNIVHWTGKYDDIGTSVRCFTFTHKYDE